MSSKITADGDCSHEIKRCLLLGRKVMITLDSILKSRDFTLSTKIHLVKAMVFPVVMYGCESWAIKKAELRRINAFELWCWRRLLKVPWTARRSNQSILKKVKSLNHVRLFATPWTGAHQASLSITNFQSLPKLMSIELVMPSSHLILCRPLLLLPSVLPSIRVSSNESALCMRWPKYWEFHLQHHSFQRTPRTDLLQNGLVGSPCGPRDSQESSLTPQFKSINSSALSFLHSPTLTSIHDHRKNHSLD